METGILIQRIVAAPIEEVFSAWTKPEILSQWWGPPGTTAPVIEVDLRVGGKYRLGIQNESGTILYVVGEYQEVLPPRRLIYTWQWEQDDPDETLVTVDFRPVKHSQTEIALKHERFTSVTARTNHHTGWDGCLDKLSKLLTSNEETAQ